VAGAWISHTCGKSQCINPKHLFPDINHTGGAGCVVYPRPCHASVCRIKYSVDCNGCWICTSHVGNSSGYINIRVNGGATQAHIFMYKKYKGPVPAGLCVLHTCDNRACINPEHLFLGTKADNTADMMRKGRHGKPTRKLNESEVLKIRSAVGTYKEIASRFNVSVAIVKRIRTGRTWNRLLTPDEITNLESILS
jgi:hypothetical protein